MSQEFDLLLQDIEKIRQISIVPTMLEVICRTTGMGFAAIARVTESKWIACSVRDEILFGLKSGGELELETTICNEIRASHHAVVIDNVSESEEFRNHHTPKMYGFKSYISVPIFLRNGEFFGTLCAIDPKPATLNNVQTVGMFNLFAELISFHLHSIELVERSRDMVTELNWKLEDTSEENLQYQFISHHNLQEPLRKLRLYSDSLLRISEHDDPDKAKVLASKINASAEKLSMMIKDVSAFTDLNFDHGIQETLRLSPILNDVLEKLKDQIAYSKAIITVDELPVIEGSASQIEQLFHHLIKNAIRAIDNGVVPILNIRSMIFKTEQFSELPLYPDTQYVRITFENNSVNIHGMEFEKIFHILYTQSHDRAEGSIESGLARCKKIVRLHKGTINVERAQESGSRFIVVLPIKRNSGHH